MYCENCGKELEAGSQFCTFCGNKLRFPSENQNTGDIPQVHQTVQESEFLSPEDKGFYEKWKENGRISLGTTDILGLIGVFIFGWLLWYVYSRVGKSAWYIFVPIIFCYLGGRLFLPLIIIGLVIYIWAWSNIRSHIKRYEAIYKRETSA